MLRPAWVWPGAFVFGGAFWSDYVVAFCGSVSGRGENFREERRPQDPPSQTGGGAPGREENPGSTARNGCATRISLRCGTFCFGSLPEGRRPLQLLDGGGTFGILLVVRRFSLTFGVCVVLLAALTGLRGVWAWGQAPGAASSSVASPGNGTAGASAPSPAGSGRYEGAAPQAAPPSVGLNIVVLDPAHGGTDLGARGTEGIRESEVVLQFAAQAKQALEAQGFQVLMTRQGNDNPSFDDRSARVNAQRGAIFITLHVASTGLAGTVRTYVMPEFPPSTDAIGLIPWDRAQAPFVGLSHKLGDLVQGELAKRFKGSPGVAETAPVRQLRTTAAPAIAVEISSVSVASRGDLDRMIPGVADAIARGVAAFRPSYVVPGMPGTNPGPPL
jgi:N-acetylmuramoyl-L-alanine amidase